MKNFNLLYISFYTIILLIIGCQNTNDTSETSTKSPVIPKCVGLWKTVLPFKVFTGYDIALDLDIKTKPDNIYSLVCCKKETLDTVLVHSGYWELDTTVDTIYLKGTSCRVLDTTLNRLVERNCNTVPVYTDINNNEWKISLASFLPIASQMNINIPPAFVPMLQKQTVILTKQ